MADSTSESTPLMAGTSSIQDAPVRIKPVRNVTFNAHVQSSSPPRKTSDHMTSFNSSLNATSSSSRRDGGRGLSALNSKLRRRNSQGAPLLPAHSLTPGPKIGPQRSTRKVQKLKLLPNPEEGEDGPDEESGREVYSQFTRIKDPTARRDAARLGKEDRTRLPRVTAYCTAGSYKIDDLLRFLKGKTKTRSAAPRQFDECIYTPYQYAKPVEAGTNANNQSHLDHEALLAEVHSAQQRRFSDSAIEVDENAERRREDLLAMSNDDNTISTDAAFRPHADSGTTDDFAVPEHIPQTEIPEPAADFDTVIHIPEVFLFEYGVVVIWGMTVAQELRFLKEMAKFEVEKLAKDDVQTENFNFYYTKEYQARIYNDFISLREKKNYMTKLAISHALAQSTKTSLYEDLVDNTIDFAKEIPSEIAQTGRVNLTRKEINMQIGELFILRINIHLQGSVLDAPELMWSEPQLEPVYQAVRSYLEMDQRVGLLTERLDVIADLLQVLKDQLSHTHGEYLEWIVIVLIAAEILVACINILVDLYAGVE